MPERRLFYGWAMIPVAWFIYGFGISPAFYSWGIYLPQLLEDLDLSRTEVGAVFGLFTLCYSLCGPLVGMAISRWGLRWVMTAGSLVAAVGLALVSRADSAFDCYVGYSILGGLGIGFSTIVPAQNLASNWFVKYRATAIAIVMTAGGIVARVFVAPFDRYILENHTWREGWLAFAGISVLVAVTAAVFVKNTPEDMGLEPDGASGDTASVPSSDSAEPQDWTAAQALMTRQFWLIVVAGVAYAVPWGVVVNHGPLHLTDLGLDAGVAAVIIGNMAFVSIFGRLSGALGDVLAPQKLLGIALLVEAAGIGGLLLADSQTTAYFCVIAIGLGFGISYISVATVFSAFFGRRAFATTAGTRISITGIANSMGPPAAGMVFDSVGSYQIAFAALVVISLIGSVASFAARPPTHPDEHHP